MEVESCTGVSWRTIQALELGTRKTVDLQTLYLLCHHYQKSLLDVVEGRRSIRKWPAWFPELTKLEDQVRSRMRAARIESGLGTIAAAHLSMVHPTWIVREESGEISSLDLVRLDRLAKVLNSSLICWITPHK